MQQLLIMRQFLPNSEKIMWPEYVNLTLDEHHVGNSKGDRLVLLNLQIHDGDKVVTIERDFHLSQEATSEDIARLSESRATFEMIKNAAVAALDIIDTKKYEASIPSRED